MDTLVPTVHERLARCGTSVYVTGLTPGATVALSVGGATINAVAPGAAMNLTVPSLGTAAAVKARQDAGSGFTPWSPEVIVENAAVPPPAAPRLIALSSAPDSVESEKASPRRGPRDGRVRQCAAIGAGGAPRGRRKEEAMAREIEAGAVAGVVAALLVDVVALGRAAATSSGGSLSILAAIAENVGAHGPWVGGLIALVYGAALGALFGWLLRRQRLTELAGLFWGILYGLLWGAVTSLVVVPLVHGGVPFGAAGLALGRARVFRLRGRARAVRGPARGRLRPHRQSPHRAPRGGAPPAGRAARGLSASGRAGPCAGPARVSPRRTGSPRRAR